MFEAVLAAFKAIPLIAKGIEELVSAIREAQDAKTAKAINEIKQTNAIILKKIEGERSDEELKKLIRDLNSNLNR